MRRTHTRPDTHFFVVEPLEGRRLLTFSVFISGGGATPG
jgi:hypothetical protein